MALPREARDKLMSDQQWDDFWLAIDSHRFQGNQEITTPPPATLGGRHLSLGISPKGAASKSGGGRLFQSKKRGREDDKRTRYGT